MAEVYKTVDDTVKVDTWPLDDPNMWLDPTTCVHVEPKSEHTYRGAILENIYWNQMVNWLQVSWG